MKSCHVQTSIGFLIECYAKFCKDVHKKDRVKISQNPIHVMRHHLIGLKDFIFTFTFSWELQKRPKTLYMMYTPKCGEPQH